VTPPIPLATRNQGEFGWIKGDTSAGERAVERMRTRTPDLYRIMQVQRNAWWTQTIDGLLKSGGTHFIGIGQMHTLGPTEFSGDFNGSGERDTGLRAFHSDVLETTHAKSRSKISMRSAFGRGTCGSEKSVHKMVDSSVPRAGRQ